MLIIKLCVIVFILVLTPFPSHTNIFSSLLNSLGCSDQSITDAALHAGWGQRLPRKINALNLLNALCFECTQGTASYNDVASRIHADHHGDPSRQALASRMNEACLRFFQSCLATLIHRRLASSSPSNWLTHYNRVIVQDSTVLKLPTWLFAQFSGVSNAHSSVCNARIQAVYDLKNKCFLSFSIDSYSKNDLLSAPELELQKGDLVLRDRGYLIADELQRHLEAGAHCIYRHKTGTLYLDPQSLLPIDLHKLLLKNGCLDQVVLLNNRDRTRVRLLSAPVNEETANLRRMKAKKENPGHNPSEAVLALMGWTIFITTIARKDAGFKAILVTYGLRWRIEILFKTWKSHLNFDVLHRVSERQLRIHLTARLLVITACTNWLYKKYYQIIKKAHARDLSLLKFLNYVMKKPQRIPSLCAGLSGTKEQLKDLCATLKKYCCYDIRKRKNFHQICEGLA